MRHHDTRDRDLALAALHRLGLAAGARRVDEHEQVARIGVVGDDGRVLERGDLGRPLLRIDVDVVDIEVRCGGRISQHHLAIRVRHVADQRGAPPNWIQPHRHDARQRRGDEHRREERCVLQQHPDMRRAFRIETCLQRRCDRGAVPDVVTPAGEGVLELHAPTVNLDQWCQQVGDGRQTRAHR